MGRYYCGVDYCDIYLTHDAPRVRRDHNFGWKHATQVRAHYMSLNQDKLMRPLGEIAKDYEQRRELIPVPAPVMMRPPPGSAVRVPPSAQLPLPNNPGPFGGPLLPPLHPSPPTPYQHQLQHQHHPMVPPQMAFSGRPPFIPPGLPAHPSQSPFAPFSNNPAMKNMHQMPPPATPSLQPTLAQGNLLDMQPMQPSKIPPSAPPAQSTLPSHSTNAVKNPASRPSSSMMMMPMQRRNYSNNNNNNIHGNINNTHNNHSNSNRNSSTSSSSTSSNSSNNSNYINSNVNHPTSQFHLQRPMGNFPVRGAPGPSARPSSMNRPPGSSDSIATDRSNSQNQMQNSRIDRQRLPNNISQSSGRPQSSFIPNPKAFASQQQNHYQPHLNSISNNNNNTNTNNMYNSARGGRSNGHQFRPINANRHNNNHFSNTNNLQNTLNPHHTNTNSNSNTNSNGNGNGNGNGNLNGNLESS